MLNTYLTSGFSCTEGDLIFSNFSYVPGGLPTSNNVQVTPVDDGTNFGFFFNGAFQSGAGMSSDAVLAYNISTADKAAILAGDTVSLISYGATGGGNVQIVEGLVGGEKVVTVGAFELSREDPDVLEKTKIQIEAPKSGSDDNAGAKVKAGAKDAAKDPSKD